MCGIAGKFNFADRAPVPVELIERMNTVQAHRGPDGSGIHLGPGVGLGHRRLSIIDVAGGHQPLANEDGQVWISFNGEIYNFPELRQQLEARGHQFRTNTDTEVIVHLYEDQGERCVESLRGMFAFALWDQRRETLLLARDRLGIKPLHYAVLENRSLVFGSEIKAVLADPAVPRRLDPEALAQYLHFLYVPTPRTMFAGIRKLPAAHVLVGNRQGIRLHRYWDLTYGRAAPPAPADCAARLHDLLRDTVRDHLVSDVPLGAFLSGGVDSSSIVALMREAVTGPVLTSSIGFAEADYNELPFARLAADRFQTQHHDEVVAPNVHGLLPKLVRSFDEPYADSSAVPTFHVSAAARRHVTVALSGDGGDELFAGYRRFELERLEHRLRRRLGPLVGAGDLFRHLPRAWKFKGRNSLESLAVDPAVACARKHYLLIFTPEQQHQLLAPEFSASLAGFDPFCEFHRYYREAQAPAGDWLNRALYVDLKTYLADDILTKVDR
ncbi:asparagine synthase (glutamine-hydrolyzing), partial [bacterium]|nr:asparagine synthase (glutamine-hydrolyzing) [bacterium]